MRHRTLLLLSFLFFESSAFALDRWIPIAGSVGVFHTDVRVFNPSATKDIEITAKFLPVGNADNNGAINGAGVKFTVAKRQMKILDDVTTVLFNSTQLGAILLTSADDFAVTSKIYALTATGTLGQSFVGLPPGEALSKGVLLQLKSGGAFRTNVGAVNIANATTTVTWRLYDKNDAILATATSTMPPYAVIGPTNMIGLFSNPSGDFSDAWVSFTATNPIFAYGSVVDNATTDPTSIPALLDSGETPPQNTLKTFDVTLSSFEINIAPQISLNKGDQAKFRVRSTNGIHGFQLIAPNGTTLIPPGTYSPGGAAVEFTFTATDEGTYTYFCTNSACGEGHNDMIGSFAVGKASEDPGRGY